MNYTMYNDTAQDQEESIWHPTTPSTINQSKVTGYFCDWRSGEVGDTGGSRSVQANKQRQAAHTRGDERQDDSKAKQEQKQTT